MAIRKRNFKRFPQVTLDYQDVVEITPLMLLDVVYHKDMWNTNTSSSDITAHYMRHVYGKDGGSFYSQWVSEDRPAKIIKKSQILQNFERGLTDYFYDFWEFESRGNENSYFIDVAVNCGTYRKCLEEVYETGSVDFLKMFGKLKVKSDKDLSGVGEDWYRVGIDFLVYPKFIKAELSVDQI